MPYTGKNVTPLILWSADEKSVIFLCGDVQVCLFSYGQTGAGKTHTMQGSKGPDGQGIIPRAILKVISSLHRYDCHLDHRDTDIA